MNKKPVFFFRAVDQGWTVTINVWWFEEDTGSALALMAADVFSCLHQCCLDFALDFFLWITDDGKPPKRSKNMRAIDLDTLQNLVGRKQRGSFLFKKSK